ncbi:MAG: DMT family transporter [Patescibacteria group bacterium]
MPLLTPARKGELSIFLSAVLWSLFPVVTILTFTRITPLFSAAIGTLLAAVFFASILSARKRWHELALRDAWWDMVCTSFFIGVLFYGLMFTGLRFTTAGNGAILGQMEVFFSFLILGLFLKHEPISLRHALGGALMVLGAMIILLPKASGFHGGDFFVMGATVFSPIGNTYAQKARRRVSTETIMFFRSVFSGLFLLLLAAILEPFPSRAALTVSLGFLLLNGIVLMGLCKILWIEGIHRIPITKAISLESIMPFFTLIVAYAVLGERVTPFQISGLLPIIAGIFLLTKKQYQGAP